MTHDINLNIHYTAPEDVWKKVEAVYSTMPYWAEGEAPHWVAENINLEASVEPSGVQIYGSMPKETWEGWYALLKQRLSEALGYEIGEPEDGHDFQYFD